MKNETKIAENPFEEAEYCVFDFETTGTSPRYDKVIEIGIVKIKKGKIVDTFSSFINPGRPVPFFITQMTGITNSDVQDAPYFDEVYSKIKDFFGESILVAHNLKFDNSFLKHECENAQLQLLTNHSICTLQLARRIFPLAPSKSLGSLVKYLKIRHRDVHRGLGDAVATAKILIRMFNPLRSDFNIDTISDLISFQKFPLSAEPFRIIKKKLMNDLSKVPDMPGVYFFKNAKGGVIYIGKAKSLRERVKNHFMSNAVRKSKEIIRKADSLGFQVTNSELTALIAEAELIKSHNPKFNTLLKKFPRNYFLKITHANKFPTVEVSYIFDIDGNDYFGPYTNRETAAKLKEIIDKTFRLRECDAKEFKKNRKCYLSDIKRCLAPCEEKNIDEDYNDELIKVVEFLSGHNQSAVDRLLNKMKDLSSRKKFEEAAQLRDLVQIILKQLQRSSILAEPINKAKALIEINSSANNDYILLIEGKVFFKNYFIDQKDFFDEALSEHFCGTIQLQKELREKDLERLKITLSWLSRNRHCIKPHYLKNYTTINQLNSSFIFKNN